MAFIGSVHVALEKVLKLYICIRGQLILVNVVGFLIAQGCFVTYCLAELAHWFRKGNWPFQWLIITIT